MNERGDIRLEVIREDSNIASPEFITDQVVNRHRGMRCRINTEIYVTFADVKVSYRGICRE